MAKIKGPSTPVEMCPGKLKFIMEGLFPMHDPTFWLPTPYGEDVEVIAEKRQNNKLVEAAKQLKSKKAPNPDGIPKVTILAYPDMFM